MTVVAAALIDNEQRVLLQQRAPDRSMPGLWEFPGGKVEPGEGKREALVREIEEELGVRLDPAHLEPFAAASAEISGRPMILLLYLCRNWGGEPRALDAAALRWVKPAGMEPEEMPPADRPLVERLRRALEP